MRDIPKEIKCRLDKTLTVDEFVEVIKSWTAPFPNRGKMKLLVANHDGEYGISLTGITGIREDGIRSEYYPAMSFMRILTEDDE